MDYSDRVYSNSGNPAVVALVDTLAINVLDVGCGAGDNAALLKSRAPQSRIYGITASPEEARLASRFMEKCWVGDLESALPGDVSDRQYDVLMCSHVLEHLRDPARVVERLSELLRPGGSMIIAVPNVLGWRQRLDFLTGKFVYTTTGVMDETHLRFFTYDSAPAYLLAKTPGLRLVERRVTGSVPLWILRRRLLPDSLSATIDALGCRLRPNLFGGEVLLRAIKSS